MVTIFKALDEGSVILKENNIDNPRLDSEVILSHVLGCDRLHLLTERSKDLEDGQYNRFKELIDLRSKGMPSAYLVGSKEFMGISFAVAPGILIPRGDTEIVVEKAIEECSICPGDVKLLDVGCGSGAIGISVAKYVENAYVTLIDICDDALKIAAINARKNRVEDRVRILKGDLLYPVMDERFDIIVSNPPYIESGVIQDLDRDVREYEPLIALDGGVDGLMFYRSISSQALVCLKVGGFIIYEIGYNQAEAVNNILVEKGFRDIKVFKDLGCRDRCIVGRK